MNFNEMNLMKELLQAIKEEGFVEPSPIQKKTIPLVLEGKDIIGCAQTGTGKTAAFALPILQNLSKGKRKGVRALIITPTRELAIQIYESFECFGKHTNLKQSVIYGGVGQSSQVNAIKSGLDILIATPGRLNDLIGQGYVKLDEIEMFVLDEADQMLDMGFLNDIKKVIKLLPQKRQTLLFSATMPKEIETLATGLLHKPEIVKISPVTSTVDSIEQSVYFVDRENKISLLTYLIKEQKMSSVLVFTRTKHGADRVADKLNKAKVKTQAIHGGKGQNARQTALSDFKEGKIKVLVATDIAARGIDISELSYVVNFDIPNPAETYIHRIGRTGRAGLGGNAINLCNIDDLDHLREIEKHIGKTITEVPSKWPMLILEKTEKPVRGQRPQNAAKNVAKNLAKDSIRAEAMALLEGELGKTNTQKKPVSKKGEESKRTSYSKSSSTKTSSTKTSSIKKKTAVQGNKKAVAGQKQQLDEKKQTSSEKRTPYFEKKQAPSGKKKSSFKENQTNSSAKNQTSSFTKNQTTSSTKKSSGKGKNATNISKKNIAG